MRDTYGRSLPLPSMRFDLESSSWRTCEATSLWDLEMSSPSFPEWGMTLDGELFELPTPERPTVGQGSSSLPTPTARDYKDTSIAAAGHRPSDEDTLSRALHHLLPTPVADNSRGLAQPGTDFSSLPNVAINLLSTPRARLEGNDVIKDRGHNFLEEQIANLLPTPRAQAREVIYAREDYHGNLEEAIAFLPGVNALLPTPRAQNGESRNQNIYARPLDQPQNLENAIAHMPSVNALLPTPTVMDMGSNYTPEEWEAWKLKQKEAHRNGNGHGASLTQEAIFLLPTPRAQEPGATTIGYGKNIIEAAIGRPQIDPSLTQEALSIGASTQGQFFDGSESSDDQPQIQLSPE